MSVTAKGLRAYVRQNETAAQALLELSHRYRNSASIGIGGIEMRKKLSTSILGLLLLSGCASIEAGDEVKGLQESSSNFADALKAAETEQDDSEVAFRREEHRMKVLRGSPVAFTDDCVDDVDDANEALDIATKASPYDRAAADRAYNKLRVALPCDAPNAWRPRMPSAAAPPSDFRLGPVMASGSNTLSGTGRRLEAYVDALSDVATGETAAKTDAARSELMAAGKGLLSALKVGPGDALVNAADAAISSIIAAKRNAATREFLDEMDQYMPTLMERVGAAARLAHAQAALNRAYAADNVVTWANERLESPDMFRKAGKRRSGTQARVAIYDDVVSRLAAHNSGFMKVTSSDPMAAARAFAEAHHALREIYHDPRASRRALAQGLASFQEAAIALKEALQKTPGAES
jgi:hypothetical protein